MCGLLVTHQSGLEQDMSVSCGCTTTMYDFNAPLWFPTTPRNYNDGPDFINVFNLHFMAVGLGIASPRQGIMQETKTAILKEQKTTARCTGEKEASFLLGGGNTKRWEEGSTFVRTIGPSFHNIVPSGRLERKCKATMLATAHVDVTCYCCCCCLRIPWFTYLPTRSLGMRKDEY